MATAEPSDLAALAALVVRVLHLGDRKADRMAHGLCASFGIDLAPLLDEPGGFNEAKVARIQAAVVDQLLDRCPDPETLLLAFIRNGASVIAMVDAIYRLLADHEATTSGTSEAYGFHLVVDDLDISLSDAFFERIDELVRLIVPVELGTVDTDQLGSLVGLDNGESYGSFPTEGDGRPLLHEVMLLRPVRAKLEARAMTDRRWVTALEAHRRTAAAADRLLDRLEDVLRGWAAGILGSPDPAVDELDGDDTGWSRKQRAMERATLLEHGLIGGPVPAALFEELEEQAFIGVRVVDVGDHLLARPVPMASTVLADRWGNFMSALGCYLGLVRSGLTLVEDRWSAHYEQRGTAERVVAAAGPQDAITWLQEVAQAANLATEWIDGGLWMRSGETSAVVERHNVEELLNLPLWSGRETLFEIWVLCRTLRATEAAGWSTRLTGLQGQVWTLPKEKAAAPVAQIERSGVLLDIWREPDRGVTPDLAIATPAPWNRDLVIIEVKDRLGMPTGIRPDGSWDDATTTAVGRATSYVRSLGAPLTWVCDHCRFKGALPSPDENLGTSWHRVHLAGDFGPESVPAAFDATIADTISPDGAAAQEARRLVLVLDTTQSMHEFALQAGAVIRGLPSNWFASFAALLVGDHGHEPYVVHQVEPHDSPTDLWAAILAAGTTHGGDAPEALEDAMHAAWAMSTGEGMTFVVITDAPPHPPDACPENLDFAQEVAGTLATGASVWVIEDRLGASAAVWQPFEASTGFRLMPLHRLHAALDPSPASG